MNPLTIKIIAGAAIILAAFGSGWAINGWRLNEKAQEQRAERAEVVVSAVGKRIGENSTDEAKHAAINQKIEVTKNEELAPVILRIADAPRLRVGSAICTGPVAGTSEAESSSSSNAEDSRSRMVREDADRDIRALKIKVEEALATGRACQAFVRENGLAP